MAVPVRDRTRKTPHRGPGGPPVVAWIVLGVLLVTIAVLYANRESLRRWTGAAKDEPPPVAKPDTGWLSETEPVPRDDGPWTVEALRAGQAAWIRAVHDWVVEKTAALMPYQEAKGLPPFWAARRAMDRADAKASLVLAQVAALNARDRLEREAAEFGVEPGDIAEGGALLEAALSAALVGIGAEFERRAWDPAHFDRVARARGLPGGEAGAEARFRVEQKQLDAERFAGYLGALVVRDARGRAEEAPGGAGEGSRQPARLPGRVRAVARGGPTPVDGQAVGRTAPTDERAVRVELPPRRLRPAA